MDISTINRTSSESRVVWMKGITIKRRADEISVRLYTNEIPGLGGSVRIDPVSVKGDLDDYRRYKVRVFSNGATRFLTIKGAETDDR